MVPVPKEDVLAFFGYLCRPAYERSQVVDIQSIIDEPDPYSSSHIKGFRSALLDHYGNIPFDEDTNKCLNGILEGYEKTINELKKKGLMKPGEGKRDLKPRG